MNRADFLAALLFSERIRSSQATDFAAHLFDQQKRLYHDPARIKACRAGRRGGKSTTFAAMLLRGVRDRPGSYALYLTLTRKNAKRIVLPAVRKVLEQNGLPFVENRTDLEIRIRGGGTLVMGGVDTDDQVEKYRGLTYEEAVVDECQSFPSPRLRSLHNNVLRPAMMDTGGPITFGGTPGYVPAGYWYELSGPNARNPVHHWTARDNPHIPNVEAELAAIREENGWDEDHPTYLREYEGLWVVDADQLVYPFNDRRNGVDELPIRTAQGELISPAGWRHVISVDVGSVHDTAFVVVAVHPDLPEDFIVHAEKMHDMTTDRMAARIRDLLVMFPGPVVMDTQGVGRRHADEVRRRFGIPVEAAEKADKASGIRIVRDRILSGRMKAVRGASAPLTAEWSVVVWNDKHDDHEREQEDHCCDAAIYAVRRARHYRDTDLQASPPEGSPQWWALEEQRIRERLEQRVRRRRDVAPWEQ